MSSFVDVQEYVEERDLYFIDIQEYVWCSLFCLLSYGDTKTAL